MQAIFYDAVDGRFISRDPIGELGGLNLYRYCDNSPVLYIDIIEYTPIDAKEILKSSIFRCFNMSLIEWINKVRVKGEWDYKNRDEYKARRYVFEGMLLTAEDLGNLNYAVTGMIVLKRFDPWLIVTPEILKLSAGIVQAKTTLFAGRKEFCFNPVLYFKRYPLSHYMVCPRDQFWIDKGIKNFTRIMR